MGINCKKVVTIVGRRSVNGYLNATKYPVIQIKFQIDVSLINHYFLKRITSFFQNKVFLGVKIQKEPILNDTNTNEVIKFLIRAHDAIMYLAGSAVVEPSKVLNHSKNGNVYLAIFPCLHGSQNSILLSINWLVSLMNEQSIELSEENFIVKLNQVISKIKRWFPQASNTFHLLNTAYSLNIPFRRISGDLCSFGQGSKRVLMSSTFTDRTPAISVIIARDKVLTSKLLREALLPVPEGRLVKNLDDAIKYSLQLKFPVVVKPSDRDGGIAVAAGIGDLIEMKEAYQAARKISSNILVEKHFDGNDFRVVVYQGEVIWVAQRLPGGVMGDGIRTINELIASVNSDPKRMSLYRASLKALEINDEANIQLKKNGLTLKSVPKSGEYVSLRRSANINNGGTPINRTQEIHPDNAQLAIKAAKVLNLDLAGIDLLINDISKSWLETGAVICEVNAQPSLGSSISAHLYTLLLKKIIKDNGRVPIIALYGLMSIQLLSDICSALSAINFSVGYTNNCGDVYIKDELQFKNASLFDGGCMLLSNNNVDIIVLTIDDLEMSAKGLPFDRCDFVFLGDSIDRNFLTSLKLACEGTIFDLRKHNKPHASNPMTMNLISEESAVKQLIMRLSDAQLNF